MEENRLMIQRNESIMMEVWQRAGMAAGSGTKKLYLQLHA